MYLKTLIDTLCSDTWANINKSNGIMLMKLDLIKHRLVNVNIPGLEVLKLFSCSTQLSTKFQLLIKAKYQQMKTFLALSLSDVFIMLIIFIF